MGSGPPVWLALSSESGQQALYMSGCGTPLCGNLVRPRHGSPGTLALALSSIPLALELTDLSLVLDQLSLGSGSILWDQCASRVSFMVGKNGTYTCAWTGFQLDRVS